MSLVMRVLACLLANRWRAGALALLAVLVVQTLRLDSARSALDTERARHTATKVDLGQARANRKALEQALAGQSAAVDALARKGEAARARAAQAENLAAESRRAATELRHRLEAESRQAAAPGPARPLSKAQEEAWNALSR